MFLKSLSKGPHTFDRPGITVESESQLMGFMARPTDPKQAWSYSECPGKTGKPRKSSAQIQPKPSISQSSKMNPTSSKALKISKICGPYSTCRWHLCMELPGAPLHRERRKCVSDATFGWTSPVSSKVFEMFCKDCLSQRCPGIPQMLNRSPQSASGER